MLEPEEDYEQFLLIIITEMWEDIVCPIRKQGNSCFLLSMCTLWKPVKMVIQIKVQVASLEERSLTNL